MVYDRKCKVIVMLSDLVEGGQVRITIARGCMCFMLCFIIQEVCYQYWPSSGSQRFGEFKVEILGEEALQGFVLKNISVQHPKVRAQLMH